jgi:hypothetical protein
MDPGRFIAAIAIRSISLLGHPEDIDRMGQDLGDQTCTDYFSFAHSNDSLYLMSYCY